MAYKIPCEIPCDMFANLLPVYWLVWFWCVVGGFCVCFFITCLKFLGKALAKEQQKVYKLGVLHAL